MNTVELTYLCLKDNYYTTLTIALLNILYNNHRHLYVALFGSNPRIMRIGYNGSNEETLIEVVGILLALTIDFTGKL